MQDIMCLAPWPSCKTYCVLRRGPVTLIFGNLLIKICKNSKICIKIHRKSTKYPLLEPPWDALGTMLAALGNQDAPKRRPRAPRRRQNLNFRANLAQLGSNLEAQTSPKSCPNAAQDPDPLLQQVWRFCRPFQHLHRFLLDFLVILKSLKPEKYGFSKGKNYFLQNRDFR